MRVLLIMTAALGLAGCPEGPGERQAREELERLEKERDAAATEDVFSGLAPSADLGAAPDAASTPAAQQTCAGMNDAEAFVRCLYEGVGAGWLNTREEPGGPAVFTDGVWAQTEEMRRMAPNWERVEMLCLCETPREVRLRSVRIEASGADAAVAHVELSGVANDRPRLDLVREPGGWQVADVRHDM